MRIVVHVLFDAEGRALFFHLNAENNVEVHILAGGLFIVLAVHIVFGVVGVLHKLSLVTGIGILDNARLVEIGIHILGQEIFAREVYHRTRVASFVNDEEAGNACIFGHLGVIGTKGRRNVYDTRTILGRYVVTGNYAEGFGRAFNDLAVHQFAGLYPRHQLSIAQIHEIRTLAAPENFELLTFFCREVGRQTTLGHDIQRLLGGIGVLPLHTHIVNLRANAEGGVGRKCPGSGRPSQHIRGQVGHRGCKLRACRIDHAELCRHRCVLHIAIAARLVQFVRTQTRSCGRRIGLNGIAFVEEILLIQLFEQPPQRFDILVVVGDIGVLHIHPVTHEVAQVGPFLGVHHHVAAAACIVFFNANAVADVFLCDAQFLFNAQLNGQSVGVPSCLAIHLESLHRLVTAEYVLDGTRHHVVNTRVSVGRRRTFKEYERGAALAFCHTAVEQVLLVPHLEHLFIGGEEVQTAVLCKLHRLTYLFC